MAGDASEETPHATVLGIDGARGGWLVAEYTPAAGTIDLSFATSIRASAQRLGRDVQIIAVDIPIGLSSTGSRPADALARERLGARRSTFFPTPIRDVLLCDTFDDANARSKLVSGKGLSMQAWNLVPKIAEVDALWDGASGDLDDQLFEAHPEVSFAELTGHPLKSRKATKEGLADRCRALRSIYGDAFTDALASVEQKWRGDAIDASVLAWTAARIACGEATVLGGERDDMGRPMRLAI